MTPKRTPLAEVHEQMGAKMVDFAGWWMPVQYQGLRQEHLNVRSRVGLFDVSHMGELMVKGEEALQALQWWTTNDVSQLGKGQAQYTLLPNERGGVVDDLIVYCLEPGREYLLCVNAANTDKDFACIQSQNTFDVRVENVSEQWGQIAVQGPMAIDLLVELFGENLRKVTPFSFIEKAYQGEDCLLARTGYTGEQGFEVFVPAKKTSLLWTELLEKGETYGVQPIGLGARDTLRLEKKYSLYGNEITDETNPYEAGLGWVVKPAAKEFIGKGPMMAKREEGLKRKLIGLELLDKGVARQGYRLFSKNDEPIGELTSGTFSPSLEKSIGVAYVATPYAEPGTELFVEIRSRKLRAKVVKTPFV